MHLKDARCFYVRLFFHHVLLKRFRFLKPVNHVTSFLNCVNFKGFNRPSLFKYTQIYLLIMHFK
jgi:hypothetical protein